ncbi:hypothetical protein C2S52_011506 [Perilla frutescens var. hirtella]|nr:hypothetical protein C2S52_011506 [Perilla frutescens var. hirtella]
MNARPSSPEIVCLQCGDVGFSNAFVYCVKCLEFAVHRYCLIIRPKSFDEFVRWLCDDCEAEEQNRHLLHKKASRCKTRDHTTPDHILGYSISGTKKNDTVQLMVEEPVYEGGRPQSYDACVKISLVGCSESNSYFHPVGPGGMNDEVVGLTAANERIRCEQSSSQLNKAEQIKDNMIFNELSAHTSPIDSAKEKSSASAASIMKKDQYTLGNNPSDRPYKEYTNFGFRERAKLASDSTSSKDVKANKASLKRDHGRFYQQHHGSHPETTAALPPPLSSCSGSFGSSKKIPSAANLKEKRSASAASIMKKDQYTLGNNTSGRPYKEYTNFGFSECAKLASDSTSSKDMKANNISPKRDHGHFYQQHHESDPETTAALPPPLSSCSVSFGSSKKIPSAANLKDQHLKKRKGLDMETQCSGIKADRRGINLVRESEVSEGGNSASNHASHTCEGVSKDSTISPIVDCDRFAEPVKAPIWRGSFNIWNKEDDILEEVMAHLSILACQKVYDEASQFNPVIHLEMLSRSHVWPKSFENSEPGADSIALYFFPSERSERFYDDLVNELVEEELALKAFVQNAELLVFPSTKLPLPYWRFQGKYYLWGVFVEKQSPSSSEWESRYNPVMHKDRADNTGSCATRKNVRGESPLSPLSNCSSYGSRSS